MKTASVSPQPGSNAGGTASALSLRGRRWQWRLLAIAGLLLATLLAAGQAPGWARAADREVTGLSLSSDTPGTLQITWDASSPSPSDYRVIWAKDGERFKGWRSSQGNAYPTSNSYSLSGLEEGATYKVRARARYQNQAGPWTPLAKATIAGAPPPPDKSDLDETPQLDAETRATATGKPTISGTGVVCGQVKASRSGISDSDGIANNAEFRWTWYTLENGARTTVRGEGTSNAYTPRHADTGKQLVVRARFRDETNEQEEVFSDPWPSQGAIGYSDPERPKRARTLPQALYADEDEITMHWDEAGSCTLDNVALYRIYRSGPYNNPPYSSDPATDQIEAAMLAEVAVDDLAYDDLGYPVYTDTGPFLSEGVYTYWLFAVDRDGRVSERSKTPLASLTTDIENVDVEILDPNEPTQSPWLKANLVADLWPGTGASKLEGMSVKLSWDELPGASGYLIERAGEVLGSTNANTRTFTDDSGGIELYGRYTYKVHPTNAQGMRPSKGSWRGSSELLIALPPNSGQYPLPDDFRVELVSGTSNRYDISWTLPTNPLQRAWSTYTLRRIEQDDDETAPLGFSYWKNLIEIPVTFSNSDTTLTHRDTLPNTTGRFIYFVTVKVGAQHRTTAVNYPFDFFSDDWVVNNKLNPVSIAKSTVDTHLHETDLADGTAVTVTNGGNRATHRFTLSQAGSVTITLNFDSNHDSTADNVDLFLWKADGTELGKSAAGPNSGEIPTDQTITETLDAGVYYVAVRGADGSAIAAQDNGHYYDLTLDVA
jgi:hypothetical protein